MSALRYGRLLFGLMLASGIALGLAATTATPRRTLEDVLDMAISPSPFAAKGAVSGVARSGERLVAVGPRGLILISDDGATTWRQVPCPVGSDLVAVKFTAARTAWAVGHDAVALKSDDGGQSWERVLDGRSVAQLMQGYYAERAKSGDASAEKMQKEVQRSLGQSATPGVLPAPFLDVWFADANEGYLVGAFGLLLHTADGGKSWQPWTERTDNERRFHLYAVGGQGGQRWIVGEQGLVMRWDAGASRFVQVETPYNGTYFGLDASSGDRIVAFGLRGNAYLSPNGGAQWHKVETGIDANLVAAVAMAGDRLLLVSQAGQVLAMQADGGKAVVVKQLDGGEVLGAASTGGKRLVLARLHGATTVDLPDAAP